jgi:DNA-binding response OmpR family regulator
VQVGNHSHLACDDVLFKPFHIKDLWERLDRLTNKTYSMVK